MSCFLRHIILTFALISISLSAKVYARNDVSATASIDSTTVIQGSKASLKLELLKSDGDWQLVNAPELEAEYAGIEFQNLTIDTIDHGNGRMEIDYNYAIQAFDPGTMTIPPFHFAMGDDTIATQAVTLKVLEVDLDSLTDIHPMESVVTIPSRWYDFIPNWWIWVLAGVACIGLIVCAIFFFKRKKANVLKSEKQTPPYELAMMRLTTLQDKKLPQNGLDKEYYTELTDILRQYLEGRFGINALEMTSTQIVDSLRHNKETKPSSDLMKQILEIADFVKFAKVRPLPDDNVKSFNSAIKFVEDSKPVPVVEESTDGTDGQNTNKDN